MSEPAVIRQRVTISVSEVRDGDTVDIVGGTGARGRTYASNVKVVERNGKKYVRIGDTLEPLAWHANSLKKRL